MIATQADNPRAASPEEIATQGSHSQTEILQANSVPSALERARALAGKNGVIVITGSIYIVGEALGLLSRKPAGQGV